MTNLKEQIKDYQKRVSIKHAIKSLKLDADQYRYLYKFIKQKSKSIFTAFALIFIQILFEISILIWGKSYLYDLSVLLSGELLLKSISILFFILIAYLFVAYLSLKITKQLLVEFINQLREKWFKGYLSNNASNTQVQKKANLITKITYHFSLIQMGFNQVLTNSIYFFITIVIIISIIPSIAPSLFKYLLGFMLVYLLLGFFGYYISNKYISREQTLSSAIIKHIATSIYDLKFIKKANLEKRALKKLSTIVELDTFFRVRRSVWMTFGQKIIFVFVSFAFAISYLLMIYYPESNIFSDNLLMNGIILAILIRLAYQSLSIGLYLVPLKIGLALSVPQSTTNLQGTQSHKFKTISFSTKKVKFNPNSKHYYKNIEFKFKSNDRVLFSVENEDELNSLSNLFTAKAGIKGKPWVLRFDSKRLLYLHWEKKYKDTYYIDPEFSSSSNIAEIILAKEKTQISSAEINKVFRKLETIPELNFIFNLRKKIATDFDRANLKFYEKCLIQLAHCIIQQDKIIIIDHVWLALNSNKINNLIAYLSDNLKDSLIIIMSNGDQKTSDKLNKDKFRLTKEIIIKDDKVKEK